MENMRVVTREELSAVITRDRVERPHLEPLPVAFEPLFAASLALIARIIGCQDPAWPAGRPDIARLASGAPLESRALFHLDADLLRLSQ